jgi:hypothetical protein
MEFKEDDSILVLKGIPVDENNVVGKVAPDQLALIPMRSEANQQSFKDIIIQWKALIDESNGNYITGGSYKEAFGERSLLIARLSNIMRGSHYETIRETEDGD